MQLEQKRTLSPGETALTSATGCGKITPLADVVELGSDGSAAGGGNTWGPRKACFVGRGKAKAQVEFFACGKCNIVACALTKRVAAVGVQRRCAVTEAHTGHRNRETHWI